MFSTVARQAVQTRFGNNTLQEECSPHARG